MKRNNEILSIGGVITAALLIVGAGGYALASAPEATPKVFPTPVPTETVYVTQTPEPLPAKTVYVKPKPRPTKTIYVERAKQPASRSFQRTAPTSAGNLWPGATSVWDGQSAFYRNRAICIVKRESWHSGTYRAENPISTASGVGQWIDSTWLAHAKYAGVKVVPHASNNSPAVQDRVLVWGVHKGMYAWAWNC